MNAKDVFLAAYALISDPEKWTQRRYATTADGDHVYGYDKMAVCFCSIGALQCASGSHHYDDEGAQSVFRALNDDESIATFNDLHTHPEVMDLWRRTGEREGWL